MTLPSTATTSICEERSAKSDQRSVADGCLLTADYQPTAEDLETICAVNLNSFLPGNLPFADWLAERARQIGLLNDDRSQWLSGRVEELAKQAHFLGAGDPATFDDRDEAMLRPCGRRGYRRPWVGASVAAIGGIADALGELPGSYPEIAATLRRHLRVLERATGGAQ